MSLFQTIASWFTGGSQESPRSTSEPQKDPHTKWEAWCNEPLQPIQRDPKLGMGKDEVLYFEQTVEARHPSVAREWVGSRIGPSFKVARRLWLHASTFQAHPIEYNTMKSVGYGTAYVTNERFVFAGDVESIFIPLQKIVELTPYTDGVRITWQGSKKPYTFVSGSLYLYGNIYKALAKFTPDSPEAQLIKEHQANQELIEKAKEQGK